jgi:Rrf2 family cysteine metabolism transcriptional repressor
MIFSTKAEYGVRVMVELARRGGDQPVALTEIAEHEGLPLAYLEHLVARLRRADLVSSRRGAHGGYLLSREPAQITMAEVVEALEGQIAPIECFSTVPDGSIHCVMASDPERVCTSKMLWSRVREAIVATLEQMTLADLIPASAGMTPASARTTRARTTTVNARATTVSTTTANARTTPAGTTATPTPPTTTTPKKAVAA